MEEVVIGSIVVCVTILLLRYCYHQRSEERSSVKKTRDNSIAIHDILQDKNGNGVNDKKGFQNPTYIKDDDVFGKEQTDGGVEGYGKPRQSRQVSDISELFRPPYGDDKSLSELVFEELERTKSTESLDRLSRDRSDVTDAVNREKEFKSNSPKREVKPDSRVDEEHDSGDDCDVTETKQIAWREKLKQDLDDDVEFIDETTDDDVDESDDVSEDAKSVDDKMRGDVIQTATLPDVTDKHSLGRPLVVDNGSYKVRFGWAGKFEPAAVTRNVFGHWRAEASEAWHEALGSKFIGDEAITKHSTLALVNPVQDGKVNDWQKIQEVWNHVVSSELETEMTCHPMIVSESANISPKHRERMMEVFIESLRVPAVTLRNQAVLCSLSANRKVAMVVSSGHGVTEIVPVYEGYQLYHGTQVLPVGGRHLTDSLARLVQREKGETFTSVGEMEIINSIKEMHAFVSADPSVASQVKEEEIVLPDGKTIVFDKELSSCSESIFFPSKVGSPSPGLPQLIKNAMESIDPDTMPNGDNTILLAGGNSMVTGLQSRLQSEINDLARGLTVHSSDCSENAAWIGASLLAEQSNFVDYCVTEDEYFEHGAKIVHRKCF